jgi:hypothetical protein
MLRQELQSYLKRVFIDSKIDTEHTLFGQVYIQFELGGDNKNGAIGRVNQSIKRALTIFKDIFNDPKSEDFVLIYEYQGEIFLKHQMIIYTNNFHQKVTINSTINWKQ